MKNKKPIPIDNTPWKAPKPIQGFLHYIEIFRRNIKKK